MFVSFSTGLLSSEYASEVDHQEISENLKNNPNFASAGEKMLKIASHLQNKVKYFQHFKESTYFDAIELKDKLTICTTGPYLVSVSFNFKINRISFKLEFVNKALVPVNFKTINFKEFLEKEDKGFEKIFNWPVLKVAIFQEEPEEYLSWELEIDEFAFDYASFLTKNFTRSRIENICRPKP